jgi:exonuclease III
MSADCPESAPYLCGSKTISRGLCVKKESRCTKRRQKGPRAFPKPPANAKGSRYGYIGDYLGRHCYFTDKTLKVDYDKEYEDGEAVPDNFSCLTYNMWGLAKKEEAKHLFRLRLPLLLKTLNETNADLMCLQEMGAFSYGEMKDWIATYPFASEVPYPSPEGTSGPARNRGVDSYFVSKYKPSRVTNYGLPGVLGYDNALLVIEYPNLVVFNLYNQAGSRHSVGQEHKWIHYSRCRYDILQTILDMIKRRYAEKNIIVCGDFNFDLDGPKYEWPEMEIIEKMKAFGFIDTFRKANPKDPGLTEDTDLNPMRWNQKLVEKMLRYDAIFYKPAKSSAWGIKKSKVIGTEYKCLDQKNSAWFIKHMSEVKPDELDRLTRCAGRGIVSTHSASFQSPPSSSAKGHSKSMRIPSSLRVPINASDHFGVLTHFGSKSANSRSQSNSGTRKRSRSRS